MVKTYRVISEVVFYAGLLLAVLVGRLVYLTVQANDYSALFMALLAGGVIFVAAILVSTLTDTAALRLQLQTRYGTRFTLGETSFLARTLPGAFDFLANWIFPGHKKGYAVVTNAAFPGGVAIRPDHKAKNWQLISMTDRSEVAAVSG